MRALVLLRAEGDGEEQGPDMYVPQASCTPRAIPRRQQVPTSASARGIFLGG